MKKITAKNGPTVFLQKTTDSLCGFCVWFDAGAAYDPKEKEGLAHLFEHLKLFNNTKISNRDFILHAFTSYGYTEMSGTFLSKDTDHVLSEIVGIINDPLNLAPVDIGKEIDVICAEKKETQSETSNKMWQLRQMLLWPKDTLGNDFFGTEKTLGAITKEDLLTYNNTRIQNRNSLKLFFYGNIPESILKQNISKLRLSEKEVPAYSIGKSNTAKKSIAVQGQSNTAGIHIKMQDVPREKYHLICIVRNLLANEQISILNQELRHSKGQTYGVYGSSGMYKTDAFISLWYDVSEKNIQKSINHSKKILRNINDYVDYALLKRIVNLYVLNLLQNNYTPSGKAYFYAENYSMLGVAESLEEYCAKVQRVTLQEIKKFIAMYITKDSLYVSKIVSKN